MDEKTIKRFFNNKSGIIGGGIILILVLFALFAPLLSAHSPTIINSNALTLPPFSEGHFLGTDDVGRDLWSRLLYGARLSLGIGIAVVIISSIIGTTLGLFSGYFGGKVDWAIMRITDILMAFPSILLAIVVVSVLGPGLTNAVIAVAIVAIPQYIRIVRAAAMVEKNKDYTTAAINFGAKDTRIIFKEIFPNTLAPLIVQCSLGVSDAILNVAALGFLGLGARPPLPEWGTMLSDSRAFIQSAPWMVTLPGLSILIAVLGFNLLGDGLRDALNPKLKN